MFYGCEVNDPTLVPQKLLFLVPHPLQTTRSHLAALAFGLFTCTFLSASLLLNPHQSRQSEAEAEQAERQTDG